MYVHTFDHHCVCHHFLVQNLLLNAHANHFVQSFCRALPGTCRVKRKAEPEKAAQEVLDNLTGDWRLIFTTGTKDTQDRFKAKINYFPLKVRIYVCVFSFGRMQ